jgi:ATP synthase protein I
MTSIGNGAAKRPRSTRAAAARASREQQSQVKGLDTGTGWTIFSYLIAGIVAYGAIGWGIGKATHIGLLFPLGMVLGIAISISYVIYRYGRQGSAAPLTRGNDPLAPRRENDQ